MSIWIAIQWIAIHRVLGNGVRAEPVVSGIPRRKSSASKTTLGKSSRVAIVFIQEFQLIPLLRLTLVVPGGERLKCESP